jgi:hypothetical protein
MLGNPTFSINDILNYVKPAYLEVTITIVFFIALGFSIVILFHLNKYKDSNPMISIIKILYLLGIIALFLVALFA